MSNVHLSGPIAYTSRAGAAIFFSKTPGTAGTFSVGEKSSTAIPVQKQQNELKVAFWGEDNRFPQNIEQQMAYCGVGKFGLDWKARMLYGNGIVPGRISDEVKDDGSEIFIPLSRGKEKAIYKILDQRSMFRFWLEYFQDWTWFGNCFPEAVFSKDGSEITHFVHQESCDSRYKQMNDAGAFEKVFLSKMWGASEQQFATFDPTKTIPGLSRSPNGVDLIDESFIKTLDCIDMYNALESARSIADKLHQSKGTGFKSAIFPVNYPSVNKTYYQVPAWDGARLAGWVEIASKIPSLLKTLYSKAFNIRYHIEIPDNYFEKKYGTLAWKEMSETVQKEKRIELLEEMDKFLSGNENAYKTFISFFEIAQVGKEEFGRLKITSVKDESTLDKEMISQSAADLQILAAMGIDASLSSAGMIGTGQQRSGGSDKRESFLIYCAGLNLERQVATEPLYLMRDFNRWDEDIVYRVRDTVLTTLDTGAGTKKTLS